MLVLIADKFPADGLAALAKMGLQVDARPSLSADELPAALAETGATILVVRSTKVTAQAFERAEGLALVIRAGAGVNNIALEAASSGGVFVANCPGKNAIAVAELTMGLMLALDRRLVEAATQLKAGVWDKKRFGKARGLHGRRLGLVGFGAIAREVAIRARAFGMEVATFDPALGPEAAEAAGVTCATSVLALVADADVVSVHVPYLPATHHLIDAKVLAAMKDGALLLHAARGGVVDDTALARAVRDGRIRAGLDVLEQEPASAHAPIRNPLLELDGVYATPHIGASTDQAQAAIADEAVRIIAGYLAGGVVANAVNVHPPGEGGGATVIVRHHDRVGVLAGVLGELRAAGLNVQEMSNVIFAGHHAASATITVAALPDPSLIERLALRDDVLAVSVRPSSTPAGT